MTLKFVLTALGILARLQPGHSSSIRCEGIPITGLLPCSLPHSLPLRLQRCIVYMYVNKRIHFLNLCHRKLIIWPKSLQFISEEVCTFLGSSKAVINNANKVVPSSGKHYE